MAGFNRLEILNMALDRVGAKVILSDTSESEDARTVVRHYTFVLKRLMSRYPWRWATKRKTKSPLAATPEVLGFGYKYQLDGDYMRLSYLAIPGQTVPHIEESIPHVIEQDILYTDVSPIAIGYVSSEFMDKPHLMHAAFADALAWSLAASMAPRFLDKTSEAGDLMVQAERAYRDATYFDSIHGSPMQRGNPASYRARSSDHGFFTDYRLSTSQINLP